MRAELESLATEIAAPKFTRGRPRGAGRGGEDVQPGDAGAPGAAAGGRRPLASHTRLGRREPRLSRRHLPRGRGAAHRTAGEERPPLVLGPRRVGARRLGDGRPLRAKRIRASGDHRRAARPERSRRKGSRAGARAPLVRVARTRARAVLERRPVTRGGTPRPGLVEELEDGDRVARVDRRRGSIVEAPSDAGVERPVRAGLRRHLALLLAGDEPAPALSRLLAPVRARSVSGRRAEPPPGCRGRASTNAARSPSTRKRGPGSAASTLTQRCERTPDSCSSARNTSSSATAPSRRASTSA